ncbi:MAG: YDG domain-containing protein, partial [Methylococcaceae bacterium]|nr:YDG domain-containing protein [Methylococcaceae bacterium]
INTVAGVLGSGSLNLKNSQTLTVGTINGIHGIDPTGTGTVTIETLGATSDLILDQPIITADGNIILAAGRDFINNVLPINSGISITGTGQYFVYSNNPTNSVEGMLNYNKHYNQTYTTGVVPFYAGAGHWFFYAIAPQLLVAPDLKTITYGDALTYTPTYTGFIDGDTTTTAGISGTAVFDTLGSTSTSGNFIVGLHDAVYNASFSSLLSSLGYRFADNSGSINELTVTPLTLVVEGISANSKVYDSTTNATLSGTAFVTPLAFDSVNLGGTGIGLFDSPNVGNNSVTVSGYHLRGADDDNYLLQFPRLIANITPATLTYTANASSRVYGSINPIFSGTVTGFVGGETIDTATTGLLDFTSTATVLSAIGNYAIIGSGLTANNGNYLFIQAAANNTALKITPAVIFAPPFVTPIIPPVVPPFVTLIIPPVATPVEPVIQTNLVNNSTLLTSQLTSLQDSTTFLHWYQQKPQTYTKDFELIEVENGGIKLAKGWQMHIEFPVNSCAPTATNPSKS